MTAQRALALSEKGAQTVFIPTGAWELFLQGLEKMKLPEPITPESSSFYLRNLIVAYGLELQRKIKEPRNLCSTSSKSFATRSPSLFTPILR